MTTTTYTVTGMTCEHCVASVKEEVSEVPHVTDVQVDLASGQMTVTSDEHIDATTIHSAVQEAGFQISDNENN